MVVDEDNGGGRELKRALAVDASALIMVHNHPTTPSMITFDHAEDR